MNYAAQPKKPFLFCDTLFKLVGFENVEYSSL